MDMKLTFDPGAVIVAGGSGGIGAAICQSFAAAGLPVVFTYHNSESKAREVLASIVAAGGDAEYERVDLADAAQVDALFEKVRARHGRIGHVIYAAGPHFDFNYIGNIPNDQWHRVVDADINGAFHLIQASVRAFKAQGDGGNLTAVITAAVERVPARDIMSAAPKAAIEMLVRGVARESGRFNIRANCVGPGWINAGLGKQALETQLDENARKSVMKMIPLKRIGEAADIAWATLFLSSQQANFISGQSLAVDGGAQT
jgi:NAD(P)-dependent dehydrogenase (short-subunit alcohol dehydrogenase family)